MNRFKKLAIALSLGLIATMGVVTPASAQERIPVIPNAPIVTQTSGSCINGVFVIEPALVTLPEVYGGSWLERTTEFTAQPGEYPWGFQAWPDAPENVEDFYIPESPGGADDYRLEGGENGIAYYTVTINSVETEVCPKVKGPKPPKGGQALTITARGGGSTSTPVVYLDPNPAVPVDAIAADWSNRTGVRVVVQECTGLPECITTQVVPDLPGCATNSPDIFAPQAVGCAQDNPAAQTCTASIASWYLGGSALTLLQIAKHEVGHCIWALAPRVPWYGHIDNDRALMYYALVGHPNTEREASLSNLDREHSRWVLSDTR